MLADGRSFALVALGFAVMGASKAAGLAAPFALKRAVNSLAAHDPSGLGLIAVFAALKAVAQALNNGKNVVLSWISRPLGRKLAGLLYSHLLGLELEFHTRRKTGALLRRLERAPRAIDTLLRAVLFTFAPVCGELAVVLLLLARQGPEVVAVVLSAFGGYLLFTAAVSLGWVAEARRRMNLWDDTQSAKATEALLNIEQVKLFGALRREVDGFDAAQENLRLASQSSDAAAAFLSGGQQAIQTAGLSLCLWCVARRVLQGTASVGDIFMAQGLVTQLWSPLQFLGFYVREARQALVDLDGARDILRRAATIEDPPQPLPIPPAQAGTPVVEFDSVSFRYASGGGRAILDGASFALRPGERAALVGPSGCGKSTVGRLIPRLADATGGCVRFNGVDVRLVSTDALRSRIAVVSQDVVVFNATIRQNLEYAKPGASEAELEAALRAAQLHATVAALPLGLETLAGERGLCLSGGERQRLALARALLRKPDLLILDEATSALDVDSERGVLQALNAMDRSFAILSITHRATDIWRPDVVLTLSGGRVGSAAPAAP